MASIKAIVASATRYSFLPTGQVSLQTRLLGESHAVLVSPNGETEVVRKDNSGKWWAVEPGYEISTAPEGAKQELNRFIAVAH